MEKPVNYLFVYGTLMRGHNNSFAEKLHSLCDFEGNGYFSGLLYRIGWYPGAVHDYKSHFKVHGEIYKIQDSQDLIAELDDYEDVFEDESASLYVRRTISVTKADGSIVDCWVYLYNQSVADLPQIGSGSFWDV